MKWTGMWTRGAALTSVAVAAIAISGCGASGTKPIVVTPTNSHRFILFVWDGLRPDSISQADTPNLYALQKRGSNFSDNHSVYPSFTMTNAASLATGSYSDSHGFNGNLAYASALTNNGTQTATASGTNAAGAKVNFNAPVFTEDWGILDALNTYYLNTAVKTDGNTHVGQPLLNRETLFEAAHAGGLLTASVGKSGPAYLQDYAYREANFTAPQNGTVQGVIVDENIAWPLTVAEEMQSLSFNLPNNSSVIYKSASSPLTLSSANKTVNPTAPGPLVTLSEGRTSDPSSNAGSRQQPPNQYLADVFTGYILTHHIPDLSVFWLRNPDATEHDYGPGSYNYHIALQAQDLALGQIETTLQNHGLLNFTNIIVLSDHGHSSVSGPLNLFPLRGLKIDPASGKNAVGDVDPSGYSVSGYVRTADLLTRAGFNAYDGSACQYDPILSGIKADGTSVYNSQFDVSGNFCGQAAVNWTTPPYPVPVPPAPIPANEIIVAPVGGTEQFYIPSHDQATVQKLVTFLESREEYGPIFLDLRYGDLPGTVPANMVRLQNPDGRSPDLTVSFNWDDQTSIQGMPGITYNSAPNNRGMHGSFSPIDIHNTLIAAGPDFKSGYTDPLPTANVDIAPTIALIMGLGFNNPDGRPLLEAIPKGGVADSAYTVKPVTVTMNSASGLKFQLPTDPTGATLDTGLKGTYTATIQTKKLTRPDGNVFTYFDFAKVVRQ